jgi:1,4-alpha-glucan branching enzyme
MVELAKERANESDPLLRRALNQAARELMLAQSSDWPFILSTGTTTPYATRRFNEHIIRFNHLCDELKAGRVNADFLGRLESEDNLFPDVDYRIYAT